MWLILPYIVKYETGVTFPLLVQDPDMTLFSEEYEPWLALSLQNPLGAVVTSSMEEQCMRSERKGK